MTKKNLCIFAFVFLFSLTANAGFESVKYRQKETHSQRNNRRLSDSNSDNPNDNNEDFIGRVPVGDAVWLVVAFGLVYGIHSTGRRGKMAMEKKKECPL
jgi:hypothetical protein